LTPFPLHLFNHSSTPISARMLVTALSTSSLLMAAVIMTSFAAQTNGFYTRMLFMPSAPSQSAEAPDFTEPSSAVGVYPVHVQAGFLPLPPPTTVPMSVDSLPAPPAMHRSMRRAFAGGLSPEFGSGGRRYMRMRTCFYSPIQCLMKRSGGAVEPSNM